MIYRHTYLMLIYLNLNDLILSTIPKSRTQHHLPHLWSLSMFQGHQAAEGDGEKVPPFRGPSGATLQSHGASDAENSMDRWRVWRGDMRW